MEQEKWAVHEGHCCALHGCKYGKEDCPVVSKLIKQKYTCENCEYEGMKTTDDIEELLLIQDEIKLAKENGQSTINISVKFLDRVLNFEPDFY